MKVSIRFSLLSFVFVLFSSNLFAVFNFSHRFSTLNIDAAKFILDKGIYEMSGTLKKNFDTNMSGDGTITFSDGILEEDNARQFMTSSVYDHDAALYRIILNGSKTFRSDSGEVDNGIEIQGTGNRIEGQPIFRRSLVNSTPKAIKLANNSAELTLAVQSALNSDVLINGGTVKLENDLRFSDDRNFVGDGTEGTAVGRVDLQRNSIYFGKRDATDPVPGEFPGNDYILTHSIYWVDAADINLASRIDLTGTWTFEGSSVINGHGNILDLTLGGTLWVKNNSTLNLTDIVIKGLGQGYGTIICEDRTSRVVMSKAQIELMNYYTVTEGGFYVEGESTIITKDYDLTFDLRSSLTVDGVTLWMDGAAFARNRAEMGRIRFGDTGFIGENLSFVYSGTIQDISQSQVDGLDQLADLQPQLNTIDHGPNDVHWYNTNANLVTGGDNTLTMSFNIYLGTSSTLDHRMYLGDSGGMVVDGSGRYIHFARESSDWMIQVDNDLTVTFKNIVLKDFDPKYFNLLNHNSNVCFGDGTVIELADNINLADSNELRTLQFEGNVVINGYGHSLDISATSDALKVLIHPTAPATGSSLTLENIRVSGLFDNNVRSEHYNNTIIWRSADLVMMADYSYTEGKMTFSEDVSIKGKDHIFTYQSPQQSIVASDATLLVDRDVTFSYDSGVIGQLGVNEPIHNGIFLQADSSILFLSGCTLHCTRTGLELTRGTLIIDDKVTLTSEAQLDAQAITLHDEVDIKVLGGATMDVFGRLVFKD